MHPGRIDIDFRLITEGSADAIFITDQEGKYQYVNQAAVDLLGYSFDEFLTMSIADLVSEDQVSYAVRKFGHLLNDGKLFTELELKRKDGTCFISDLNASILSNGLIYGSCRDITQRRAFEEQLAKNESRFKTLFDYSPISVWEEDFSKVKERIDQLKQNGISDFRAYFDSKPGEIYHLVSKVIIIDINQRGLEMLGAKEVPDNLNEYYDGTSISTFKEEFIALANGSTHFEYEIPVQTEVEKSKAFALFLSVVPGCEETLSRVLISLIDITDRKQAEMALSESEQKFRTFSEYSPNMIFVNQGKDVVYVNQACVEIMGYSQDEFLSSDFNFMQLIAPDYKEIIQENLSKHMQGEEVKPYEYQLLTKGGVLLDVIIMTRLIDYNNQPAILGIVTDLTQKKRTEQIQKILYNISNAAHTSANVSRLIEFIQNQLSQVIDTTNFYVALYNEDEDSFTIPFIKDQGLTIPSFPAEKTLSAYVLKNKESLLANSGVLMKLEEAGEIKLVGSPSKIWLGVPLISKDHVIGVLVVQSYKDEDAFGEDDLELLEFVSDQISISIERKTAEQELKVALEKATESERLKSRFLSTISHELRTPLNAVVGLSDIISKDTPIEDILDYITTIKDSGNHLLHIFDDMLSFTFLDSENIGLNAQLISVQSIMDTTLGILLSEQQKQNKEHIEIFYKPESENSNIKVNTDKELVERVLSTLCRNALKFTNKGSVEFGFDLDSSADHNEVTLFIKDTGIGIPSNMKDHLFKLFRQVDDADNRKYGGIGIGLALAKRLVILLGGEIWFNSIPGKGTTFTFSLPVYQV